MEAWLDRSSAFAACKKPALPSLEHANQDSAGFRVTEDRGKRGSGGRPGANELTCGSDVALNSEHACEMRAQVAAVASPRGGRSVLKARAGGTDYFSFTKVAV